MQLFMSVQTAASSSSSSSCGCFSPLPPLLSPRDARDAEHEDVVGPVRLLLCSSRLTSEVLGSSIFSSQAGDAADRSDAAAVASHDEERCGGAHLAGGGGDGGQSGGGTGLFCPPATVTRPFSRRSWTPCRGGEEGGGEEARDGAPSMFCCSDAAANAPC